MYIIIDNFVYNLYYMKLLMVVEYKIILPILIILLYLLIIFYNLIKLFLLIYIPIFY